jgi:transcriptional regulator with XRE-family HTH domain
MPPKRNPQRTHNSDPDRDHLAQRLREAREYLGLSQEYVAQQTKIPRPAISEIEAGRRRVESLELQRLATLYGRPLSYFLVSEVPPESQSDAGASRQAESEWKLRNTTRGLPAEDIQEVVRFAEYLRHRKQTSEAARATERE